MSGSTSQRCFQHLWRSVAACCCLWQLLALPHMADAGQTYGSARTWRKDWTGLAFNYQLAEVFLDSHYIPGVRIYGIDGFDNEESMVRKLVKKGALPVCYISGGTFEDWRPDAANFQPEDKGNPLGDWPGESYIDIRSPNVRQIMLKRIQMCKSKGFVAVDVDNVDVFEAGEALTGFDLTEEEGKEYVLWLANTAHSMGMAFGLKNAINLLQHPLVVKTIDFAVNEAALEIGEAELYLPLWKASKAILNIEYDDFWTKDDWLSKACPQQRTTGLLSIFKHRDLLSQPWAKCSLQYKPSRFPPKRLHPGSSGGSYGQKAPTTYLKKKADRARRKAAAAAARAAASGTTQSSNVDVAAVTSG